MVKEWFAIDTIMHMANNGENNLNMGQARPSIKAEKGGFQVAKPTSPKRNVAKHKASHTAKQIPKKNKKNTQTNSASKNKLKNTTRLSVNDQKSSIIGRKIDDIATKRTEKKKVKFKDEQKAQVISASLSKKSDTDFSKKHGFLPALGSGVKKWIIIGLIAVVVIAIGALVGFFAFVAATNAKLTISNEGKSVLTATQDGQPYYMLFSADIDENQDGVTDMLLLTRVDPQQKKFIVVSIPTETYVASSSGGGTTLAKICANGSEGDLISSVATFCECSISHYATCNAEGLAKLIDAVGGIEVELKEHIDDPTLDSAYIPSGKSTINGKQTLNLLRSTKFNGGLTTISANQRTVGIGLAKAVLSGNVKNMPVIVDQLAGNIKTDLSTVDCINFVNSLSGVSNDDFREATVPGYKTLRNNEMVFMINASEWKIMRQNISYGELPVEQSEKTINDIDAGSFTIYVRNGSGIDGAAAMVTDKLKSLGYNVVNTDNAEMSSYEETLIIYKKADLKGNAEAVKNSLNNGRLVNGDGLYDMKTDVMVIIGGDYKI